MAIEITTLKNGLRVVTDYVSEMDSVAVGVWANVGTRNEDMEHNGVAHMVEHMLFKGTPFRDAFQIGEEIENVGGQMNAYTSREMTAYYVHLLKQDCTLAMDVIADILQHPLFPEDEMEKEKDVIIQEIGMANDTPDDLIGDHFQSTAFPKQALGAPILGTAEIIADMKQQTLFDYVRRFYTPSRLVVSAAGGVPHEKVVQDAERFFKDLPADSSQILPPARYQGGEYRDEKDLEQTHVILGFQSIDRNQPDYYAAVLLSTILGGGMSSRLFQEVREKRGLVYAVYSSHSSYIDNGQFEIYAGTGPDKLPELIPVLCEEVNKLMQYHVSHEELARAKSQSKAGMLMSRESMMSRTNRQAKHLINFNEALDMAKQVEKIEAITVDQIRSMAQRIFSTKPTLASLGPLKAMESLDKIEKRLAA